MIQVIIALVPGTLAYAWFFGPGVIVNIVLAIMFALTFEAGILKLRGKPVMPHLTDFSAVVAAWLFALCLPMHAPWWLVLTGIGFAMVAGKHLYGGLGFNPFNPAMVGYVVLLVSFPLEMTTWYLPGSVSGETLSLAESLAYSFGSADIGQWDALSSATPLDHVKTGVGQDIPISEISQSPLFGDYAGEGWEWIAFWWFVGGVYMLATKTIRWHIPASLLVGRSGGLRFPAVSPAFGRRSDRCLFYCHRSGQRRHHRSRQDLLWADDRQPDLRHSHLGRLPRRDRVCGTARQYVRAADRLLYSTARLRRRMIAISRRQILISGAFLWLFAVVGTTLVAVTEFSTADAIVENERRVLLRNLLALLPADRLDNDIANDTLELPPSPLLGTETRSTAYRARLQGEPVAVIFNSVAPNGYNGRINLLVGVNVDGSVAGVRVIKHAETPGLGDGIEIRKSPWIRSFDGKSLDNPDAAGWRVKRDGGEFDQLTGATITPRAIVAAVRNTLLYYRQNADMIFE
jgi:RnfABCDGE-type electron transport complex G subunit